MPAYIKLGDIKGNATDEDHKDWVIIESMSSPIYRSIPDGAVDQQRTQGETTLGDVVVVRQLDKSSTKIMEAVATGKFLKEVEVHFCSTINNKQVPYLMYKLYNVILSSYSIHANASGDPLPTEEVTLGYSKVDWTYDDLDSTTGDSKGKVPTKYDPGKSRA
ncbi:MAG: type VI secretion system tube protein Hcp [Planctomycetaceae bacterium]